MLIFIQVDGDGETTEALTMFDHGRFLVDGTMERGCKPLLTIRFAPSSKYNSSEEEVVEGRSYNLVNFPPILKKQISKTNGVGFCTIVIWIRPGGRHACSFSISAASPSRIIRIIFRR